MPEPREVSRRGNWEGKTYSSASPGSKNFVFVPTAAMRRQGMYYKLYRAGGIIAYGSGHPRSVANKYNPRHLPVVIK